MLPARGQQPGADVARQHRGAARERLGVHARVAPHGGGAGRVALGEPDLDEREHSGADHEARVVARVLGVRLRFGEVAAPPPHARAQVRRVREAELRAVPLRVVEDQLNASVASSSAPAKNSASGAT